MANFLVVTCIKPQRKLLGILSMRFTMILCAIVTIIIGIYNYYEAQDFFPKILIYNIFNEYMILFVQGTIGLLLFVCFLVKRKNFTRILYVITLIYCGAMLAINISKIDIFNQIEIHRTKALQSIRKYNYWNFCHIESGVFYSSQF